MAWTPSGSPGAADPSRQPATMQPPPSPLPSHVAASLLAAKPWVPVQLSSALQYSSEREVNFSLRDGMEMDEKQARSPGGPPPHPNPTAMHLPVLFFLPLSPHQEGGEDGDGQDQSGHWYPYGHPQLADP